MSFAIHYLSNLDQLKPINEGGKQLISLMPDIDLVNEFEALSMKYISDGEANENYQKLGLKLTRLMGEAGESDHTLHINDLFVELEWLIEASPFDPADYIHDQIMSYGILISAHILLLNKPMNIQWLDPRDVIKTDDNYGKAQIDYAKSNNLLKKAVENQKVLYFVSTHGVGSTSDNHNSICKDERFWEGVLKHDPKD